MLDERLRTAVRGQSLRIVSPTTQLGAGVSSSSATIALPVNPSRICERGKSVMQSLSTSFGIITANELVSTTSGGGQAAM
jgi:hypothetical protein